MKIELTYKRFFNKTGGIKGFLTLITRYINTIKAIIDIEKLVVVCIEIKPYISESVIPSKNHLRLILIIVHLKHQNFDDCYYLVILF